MPTIAMAKALDADRLSGDQRGLSRHSREILEIFVRSAVDVPKPNPIIWRS